MSSGFIPPHGGYKKLLSYQKAEIVYDATTYFCNRFFEKRDRRTRGISEWPKDHSFALRLRQLNRIPDATYETFQKGIEHPEPAVCANVIIGLSRVCSVLLDRQIRQLEQTFLKEGGLREHMTRARLDVRDQQRYTNQ